MKREREKEKTLLSGARCHPHLLYLYDKINVLKKTNKQCRCRPKIGGCM